MYAYILIAGIYILYTLYIYCIRACTLPSIIPSHLQSSSICSENVFYRLLLGFNNLTFPVWFDFFIVFGFMADTEQKRKCHVCVLYLVTAQPLSNHKTFV